MTSESPGREPSQPQPTPEAQDQSLSERFLQALGGRQNTTPQTSLSGALIDRLRTSGAAIRSVAPEGMNPGQLLMNRLRPSRELERAADQELRPLGFGLYAAIAVDFIARQPHPPRLADISRFLMQEPQSLTALIRRLEQHGWLRREPSQRDRRAVLLELTEAGRQLHQRLVRVLEDLLQEGDGEHFGASGA
jgi:DNA-binding MarR family transcriptional regulator